MTKKKKAVKDFHLLYVISHLPKNSVNLMTPLWWSTLLPAVCGTAFVSQKPHAKRIISCWSEMRCEVSLWLPVNRSPCQHTTSAASAHPQSVTSPSSSPFTAAGLWEQLGCPEPLPCPEHRKKNHQIES